MAGVRIVTDSSCDLTDAEAEGLGISVVPLKIRFGDDEFVDREELPTEDFYKRLRSSDVLPETAAPAPGAFEAAFRQAKDEGADAVVCINISSDLSATMQSAQNGSRALGDEFDVRVVDSRSITAGLGSQVLEAARAANEGKSADEIVALVADLVPRTHVFGALDTLEYLKRGGRIGGAKALVGTMLSVKPCIDISTGVVEEAAKPRTRKRALAWLRSQVPSPDAARNMAVLHADAPDVSDFLELMADEYAEGDYRLGLIGAVIGTHGGPGVMGVCWQDVAT